MVNKVTGLYSHDLGIIGEMRSLSIQYRSEDFCYEGLYVPIGVVTARGVYSVEVCFEQTCSYVAIES